MGRSSRDESDLESSCSSFTALSSRRSCTSDVSLSTISTAASVDCKPHKASQAEWAAMGRVRAVAGRVGLDHFRLIRRIGGGDLGSVYLCRLRGGEGMWYAMKVVDRDALAVRKKLGRAETEREILRAVDHPFLPTLYAEFEAEHYSCFVMEFCSGGDLHVARQKQPGRRFTLSAAKFYAAETVVALEYLHMMGVVYRDLKPENVLVREDGHIMLSDFDLSFRCHVTPHLQLIQSSTSSPANNTPSCVLSCFSRPSTRRGQSATEGDVVAEPATARSRSFVGTHEYLSPEVITGSGHGAAVDWWAVGVFLYEMLYGRTPFKGEDNVRTLDNIVRQPLRFPLDGEEEETAAARDLIGRLLVKSPKRRMGSARGAAEIKRHPFFKGVNWALIRSVRPPVVPKELRGGRRITTEGPYSMPSNYFQYF